MKKITALFLLLVLLLTAGIAVCEESEGSTYQKYMLEPAARFYSFPEDLLTVGHEYERALMTAFFSHDLSHAFPSERFFLIQAWLENWKMVSTFCILKPQIMIS